MEHWTERFHGSISQEVFKGPMAFVGNGQFMSDKAYKVEPWYSPGLTFKCTQCGNCCSGPSGYVWFTDAEAQRIADFLGVTLEQFLERYTRPVAGRPSLDEIKRGRGQYDCVFLRWDEHGKSQCGIYPVRPGQCRTWPFWPENIHSRRAWEEAAKICPGMGRSDGDFVPMERVRILARSTRDQDNEGA